MNIINDVTLYTDGSCLGNPGPGGWAAILGYFRDTCKKDPLSQPVRNSTSGLSGSGRVSISSM